MDARRYILLARIDQFGVLPGTGECVDQAMAIGTPTRGTVVLAVSAFLVIAAVHAQVTSPVSEVKVTVYDQSGAVIADGEVDFKSDSKTIALHTGKDGAVTVTLRDGRYSVSASRFGFLKQEITDFHVAAPGPDELKIILMVDPHSLVCGPCGCGVCSVLVPTEPSDLPNVIAPEPDRATPAQPAAKKIRSPRCLYLWKCSVISGLATRD